MRTRVVLLVANAALSLSAARAFGQVTTPTTQAVVPPRLTSAATVAYPDGATGDAVVVLELTIALDGSVRDAHVVRGDEPFAGAAQAAAATWTFEPALRGGHAVAARIRFEVSFAAPERAQDLGVTPATGAPTPPGAAPRTPTQAANVPPPTPALEVVVRGTKLAPAVSSFTRAEVRELPGAFGDPFRAIEALPGVTPIVSGLPFYYVRGAPPGNVGYFLDGVRVPYLYHVGLGPSVVNPALVERVDLYPGGYPARFGRFTGGIVAGETTEPRADLHAEGNLRIFDVGALAEGGFAGGRGTLLLGGRYSYTAAIVSLLAPDTRLDYRDYQARITYDLTPRDRISAFAFGAYDLVGQTANNIFTILFGAEFYRLDLRYDHRFGKSSSVRTAVSLGYDQTRIADQRNARDKMIGARIELEHALSEATLLRAGVDAVLDAFEADPTSYADPDDPDTQQFNALFPSRNDISLGMRADLVLHPLPNLELTPGLRVDLFGSGGATALAVDPRISARFKLTDKFRIVHAYGLAHQPPSFILPVPGLVPGKLQGGLQTSLQTSAGVEADLAEGTTATATLFHNAFFNMSDALGARGIGLDNALDQRSLGSAVGFELFVHRRLTHRLGGALSYTLSRSTRSLGRDSFLSAFDRTHVGNFAITYDLGRRWRAGTRVVFYTGAPKILPAQGLIPPTPSLSPARDPSFFRIDARLEKRWSLGERSWISFVVEVLNATLSKETLGSQVIGPVTIPSIGVEAGL